MAIFTKDVVEARRARAEAKLGAESPLVLVGAGAPIPKPGGLDQTYRFVPHPEYYWLTGARRRGGVVAFDPRAGWTHFVEPATDLERLWEGEPEVPEGEDIAGLSQWLDTRSDRPVAILGAPTPPLEAIEGDTELAALARERLDAARRPKDVEELAIIERAARATAAGHAKARAIIRPGLTERAIQIELEAEMARHGAHGTSFDTIVGVGTHAAVLHFEPGDRQVEANDLVLVDAGAEIDGYAGDVTRTVPAGTRFTPEQQAVYDIVLAAELAGIEACHVGVEWHDVHRKAAAVIAEGLRDLGVLRGDLDGLLESEAIALFFPHGVGHMLGLGVRDVGGHAPGRPEGRMVYGARVRVDLPLELGFVMTVEPGCYFVPAMLDDPSRRERFADQVDWDGLERWRAVGGVRIEDDILVTADGPRVLTADIPK